jgi:hypothetical protein
VHCHTSPPRALSYTAIRCSTTQARALPPTAAHARAHCRTVIHYQAHCCTSTRALRAQHYFRAHCHRLPMNTAARTAAHNSYLYIRALGNAHCRTLSRALPNTTTKRTSAVHIATCTTVRTATNCSSHCRIARQPHNPNITSGGRRPTNSDLEQIGANWSKREQTLST